MGMKLNISIDLDELTTYCEESAGALVRQAIADEIGKAIRKAARAGIDPGLTAQIESAARVAYASAATKVLADLGSKVK